MLILSSTDRFALRAKRGSHPSTLNRGVSDHECPLLRSWLTALEQPECLRRVAGLNRSRGRVAPLRGLLMDEV